MGSIVKMEDYKKGLLQSEELHNYIVETSVYPREPELVKELREATDRHPQAIMITSPIIGQLISFLLKMANAKNTIELGVFTGYSLLLTALAIPNDGKIVAIDVDRKAYEEIGLPIIKKAGVEDKIKFVQADATLALDDLLLDQENEDKFDYAYVDAAKFDYLKYHERLMKLIKVGGLIAYDDTLWVGTVAVPESQVPDSMKKARAAFIEFNKFLANDHRVDIVLLPLSIGITFCRRLC